jgi:uncharacterized protein YbaR (Trm112 family)
MLRPELLEILVCPVPECRGSLELGDRTLCCSRCGRRYPIEQSWPVLIPELARGPEQGAGPQSSPARSVAGRQEG